MLLLRGGDLTDDISGGTFLLRVTVIVQGVLDSMFDTCALGAAVMCFKYRGCPLLELSHMVGTMGLNRHLASSPEHTTGEGAGVEEFAGFCDARAESCNRLKNEGGGSELSGRPVCVREDAVRVSCCLLGLREGGLMLLLNREEEDCAGRGGAVLEEAS